MLRSIKRLGKLITIIYTSAVKQVFPTFEFRKLYIFVSLDMVCTASLICVLLKSVGWYSIGAAPTPSDLSIHTQLLAYNESPIFLQLHPDTLQSQSSSSGAVSKLPLDMYESIVDIAGGKSETKFIRIATEAGGYRVETYEAERIAVETASRVSVASATATSSENQGGKGPSETGESTCEFRANLYCKEYAELIRSMPGFEQ